MSAEADGICVTPLDQLNSTARQSCRTRMSACGHYAVELSCRAAVGLWAIGQCSGSRVNVSNTTPVFLSDIPSIPTNLCVIASHGPQSLRNCSSFVTEVGGLNAPTSPRCHPPKLLLRNAARGNLAPTPCRGISAGIHRS